MGNFILVLENNYSEEDPESNFIQEQDQLQELGFRVHVAKDLTGFKGIMELEKNDVCLFIIDLMVVEYDEPVDYKDKDKDSYLYLGWKLLNEKLRPVATNSTDEKPWVYNIPIIIYTSMPISEENNEEKFIKLRERGGASVEYIFREEDLKFPDSSGPDSLIRTVKQFTGME